MKHARWAVASALGAVAALCAAQTATPPIPAASAPPAALWCASPSVCPVEAPPVAAGEVWERMALENGVFTVLGTQRVRYGTGTRWTEKQITGNSPCSNAVFGDSSYGIQKECQALAGAYVKPIPLPIPPKVAGQEGSMSVPAATAGFAGWTCMPKAFGGAGSPLYRETSAAGKAFWWLCATADPKVVQTQVLVVLDSYKPNPLCPNVYTETFSAIYANPTDPLKALNETLMKCGAMPPTGTPEFDQFEALRLAAGAAAVAEWNRMNPPPVVTVASWFVAPYVLSKDTPPTRPVFNFARSRRTGQSYSKALVDQPCDPAIASVTEGAITYMAFGPAFNPAEVTVCVKR